MFGNFSDEKASAFNSRRADYVSAINNLPLVKNEIQRRLIQHLEFHFEDFYNQSLDFLEIYWEFCCDSYVNKATTLDTDLNLPSKILIEAYKGFGILYSNYYEYLAAKHAGNEFQGKYYCACPIDSSSNTYFFRNDDLIDLEIDKYFVSIRLNKAKKAKTG